jgi:dCTP deaminase
MAVLTKQNILERIRGGEIRFDPPLDGFQMQPHAVDLRLGFLFRLPKTWVLTDHGREALNIDYLGSKNGDYFEEIQLKPGQYFELLPSEFVIVTTLEEIQMPLDLMTVLYPRTSFNRRGLAVDLSGIIDAGYRGHLTIPVRNNTATQVIKMYPGERMCQIVFQALSESVTEADALRHGLNKAKYHNYGQAEIQQAQSDRNVEMKFVRCGQLDELKKQYPAV